MKRKGTAGIDGLNYEYKFCAIVYLRAKNKGYKFKLASNEEKLGAFDDVEVEYLDGNSSKRHIFVQLKSIAKRNITMSELKKEKKGDFSLRKYYDSYLQIEKNFNSSEVGAKMDGSIDESLFIIYTNTDVARYLKPNKIPHIGEEEFLMTGGSVLQFNEEEHKAIYEHLQDPPKHYAFLSRFRIFYNQANEKEMDEHIKRELQQSMKLPESKLDLAYMCFIGVVMDWWQNFNYFIKDANSKENDLLEKTKEKLRTILVPNILDQRKSELDYLCIKYKQAAIRGIQQLIEPHRTVLIFAPGRSTTLTAAKIHQMLSDTEHIILNLQQLIRYKTEVVLAWKSKFDVLVLESQSSTEKFQDVLNEISITLNEFGVEKKLIFIAQAMGNKEQISVLRHTFSEKLAEAYDDWKFTDIITESKKFFLEKKIIFQGLELQVKDIVKESDIQMLNALDGESMSLLLADEKPSIGSPIEETLDYYIERALECTQNVNPGTQNEIELLLPFRKSSMEDLNGVSACTENNRKISDHGGANPQLCLTNENEQEPTRVCNEKNEMQCSETKEQNHPSQPMRNGFGNVYRDLERKSTRVWRPCTLLEGENRIILVIDEPGMGKSTLLTHLAKETQQHYRDMWIVRVDINNYTNILQEYKTKCFDENGAFKLLTEAAKIKESDRVQLEKQMFNYIYNSTGNMAVLIDGVDEVGPHYAEEVIKFLRILSKTKIRKIWITSRNFMKGQLEQEFQCQAYSLLPFSAEDQKYFLLMFWNQKGYYVKDLAERVVELSCKYLNDRDKSFMGVPLHSMLLAEMFEENLKQCSTSRTIKLLEHINVSMLYDSYVNKKWDIYLGEKKKSDRNNVSEKIDAESLRASFLDNHKAAALLAILSTQHFEKINDKNIQKNAGDFVQRIKQGMEKTGIITGVIDSKPVFQHRNLAEYLAARWLCENSQTSQTFMKDHLFESGLGVVRSMVDWILADKCTLHEAVLNSNTRHVAKLLKTEGSINQKDRGGRTPLHVAISCKTPEIIKLLLEHKADVSFEDTFLGLSPLEYATRTKDWQVLSFIMEKRPDIREQVLNDMNPGCTEYIVSGVGAAARYGHTDLLRYLISRGDIVNMAFPGDINMLLHEAARGNHIETVRTLVELGASCDIQDANGRRALHVAAEMGSLEVTKLLVERQEVSYSDTELEYVVALDRAITKLKRLNVHDKDGNTPLHLAAAAGKTNILSYLSSAGCDLRSCNTHGEYPLTLAARYGRNDTVKLLLQSCPAVKCDEMMTSALTAAVVAGQVETTEVLLSSGAPVDGEENEKPIHIALRMGHKEIVILLLQYGANLTFRTDRGNTPLHLASEAGYLSLVKYIIGKQTDGMCSLNDENETPLHLAARNGKDCVVNYFVENGCNINATSANDATCLHLACENGHYTTVECLLKHGAKLNAMNSAHQTPLHIAASRGQKEIVELLILDKANFTLRDKDGITALLAASINGHQDTVLFIVQQGGNIEDTDRNGKNIAHYAVANGSHKVLNFLLKNHAYLLHVQNFDGKSPLLHAACKYGHVATVQYLCDHGALLDLQDNNGNTALHVAVSNGHLKVTRVLVEKGANLCAADASGSTALHIAAKGGYLDIVQYLTGKFAPIDTRNAKNETALLEAVTEGHAEIVRVFLVQGAGIGVRNIEGKTAFDIATEKGYELITQLLKDRAEGGIIPSSSCHIDTHTAADEGSFEHWQVSVNAGVSIGTETEKTNTDTPRMMETTPAHTLGFQSNHRCALHTAAKNNNFEQVQRLVKFGTALDYGESFGRTALWVAAKSGHKSIIRYLLQNGSCVNASDRQGVTPIEIAVRESHWVAVDEFLIYKPIISPKCTEYLKIQLFEALEYGTNQTVQTILKCGISVETTNIYGSAPLHVSANYGHQELSRMLLNSGANVNVKDKQGRTPLILSATKGHIEVSRELLNHKASVYIADEYGWTPLHSAAQAGNVQFFREVLNNGVSVDVRDKYDFTPLYAAARKGHVKVVRGLLNHGASVDIANCDGETPLCIAAQNGYVQVIKVLLKRGARVDHSNNDGEAPLYTAARYGHEEVCRLLLSNGATVDLTSKRGATPLHIAALIGHVEVIGVLLSYAASVNIANEGGWTALHEAAAKGHWEVVRKLLNRGACVDTTDKSGWKPLNTAASKGHVEVVRELLKHGASVDTKNTDGCTPLNAAAQEGHVEVVRVLLNHGANVYIARDKGWTPINEAALNGHVEVVRELLNNGVGMDFTISGGRTTLYLAAANGHLDVISELLNNSASVNIVKNNIWISLHAAAEMGHVEIVRELLKRGVAVDVANEKGWTPLNIASRCGHVEVFRDLVNHGANVDAANKNGCTPFNAAAQEAHVETVRVLLNHGANVDNATEFGWTPLYTAARCGNLEVVQELLNGGASVDIANNEGATPLITAASEGHVEIVRILLNHSATLNLQDKGGFTALNAAAQSGQVEVVRELLKHEASVNIANNKGATPLIRTASEGHVEIVRDILNHGATLDIRHESGFTALNAAAQSGFLAVVEELLNRGANMNIRSENGATPLNAAALNGHVEIILKLLDHGAGVDIADDEGCTPLYTATKNGHLKAVRELLNRGAKVDIANRECFTPLYSAISSGHVEIVRELLKHGAIVDSAKESGWLLFNEAARTENLEVIRVLLKHALGENISKLCVWKPVEKAAKEGDIESIRHWLKRIHSMYFLKKSN